MSPTGIIHIMSLEMLMAPELTNLVLSLSTYKVASPPSWPGLNLGCEVLHRSVKLANGIVF